MLRSRNIIAGSLVPWLCLLLTACAAGHYGGDGGPVGEVNVANIPNAVPRDEPLSKYGNPQSYRVNGHTYYIRASRYGYKERGVASWYGTKFHGRRTSSGERYNMYAMTAAHRTLPLPTYVRVTNLQNHRQVIVKVNDRGPFHSNRIIDLSYAAAKKLGIADGGTGLVEVESINPEHYHRKTVYQRSYALKALEDHKNKDDASTNEASKHEKSAENARLFIQVGAFASRDNARQLRQRLAQLPLQAPVHTLYSAQHNLYRVRIGPLDSVEQADRLTRLVTENGFDLPHVIVD